MREVRTTLERVQPGEMLISLAGRPVNARVRAFETVTPGTPVAGPRGGSYRLTAHGAARRVGVRLYDGRMPIMPRDISAVVLRECDE